MTLRFSNLTKFGVWVFALAAVVHALNDILTDSESDSDELLYSIIEDSYYTWRNSQDVLNAKKGAGSSCISVAVFIVVLLVALLIGSGSALGVGYFFFYKKKMTAKEEEIEKLTKQIGVKAENIKTLETQIATLKASPSNAAGSSISGDAPDPTEIAHLETEVQNLEEKLVEMTGELDELREELEKAKIAAAAAVRPQHTPPPAGPSNQDLENEYGLLRAENDTLQEQLNLANNNDYNEQLELANDEINRLLNLNGELQEQLAPPNDHVSAIQDPQPPFTQQRTQAQAQAQLLVDEFNDLGQFHPGDNGRIHNSGQHDDTIAFHGLDAAQQSRIGHVAPTGDFHVPVNGIGAFGQFAHDNYGHGSQEHGPQNDSLDDNNAEGASGDSNRDAQSQSFERSLGFFIHDNEGFIEGDRFHSVMKALFAISSISSWFFISLAKMMDSAEALRCKVYSLIHYRTIKLMLKTTRLNPQLLRLLVPHLVLKFKYGADLLNKLIIQLPEVDLKSLLSKVPNLFQEIGTKFAEMVMHMPNDDLKILIRRMSLKPIETIKLQFEKALPQLMEKRAHGLASLLQLEDDKPISESLSKSLKKVIKEGTPSTFGKSIKSPTLTTILSNIYTHSTATTDDLKAMLEVLLKMNPTASKLKEAIPTELLTSSSDEVAITINE
eukprot:88423_1